MNLAALFPDLINITEAFNTNFTSIIWNQTATGLIGTASLDDEEFELYLEPSAIMISGLKRYWINVAFARKVDGELKQDLFPTGSSQSKQLGAVINALNRKLRELVSQFKIDAVVFTWFSRLKGDKKKESPFINELCFQKFTASNRGNIDFQLIGTKEPH